MTVYIDLNYFGKSSAVTVSLLKGIKRNRKEVLANDNKTRITIGQQ
jgi:hypothetical protein